MTRCFMVQLTDKISAQIPEGHSLRTEVFVGAVLLICCIICS